MIDVEFNYSKLRGKIIELYGTQDAFADAIKLGRVSLSQRMNNKLEFSQGDIFRSVEALGITMDEMPSYFFTPKVQKHEPNA